MRHNKRESQCAESVGDQQTVFKFIEKFGMQLSLIITDIVIWVGYVVELSEFYHPKYLQVNISIQS